MTTFLLAFQPSGRKEMKKKQREINFFPQPSLSHPKIDQIPFSSKINPSLIFHENLVPTIPCDNTSVTNFHI